MARCTRPSARGRTGRSRLRWPRRTCPEPGSLCAMGLLDDAIKEHLELKRRRGADPTEIERLEREALGPVRRMAEEVPGAEAPASAPADAGYVDEPAPEQEVFDEEAGFEDEEFDDDASSEEDTASHGVVA